MVAGLALHQGELGRPLCSCNFYPDKVREATQRYLRLWLTTGGGLCIVLFIAGGWVALHSRAAMAAAQLTRAVDSVPMIVASPPPATEAMTPAGTETARIVFTQVRSMAPP